MQKKVHNFHENWIKSLKVGYEVIFDRDPITVKKVTAIYPDGFSRSDLTLTGYIVEVDNCWYFNVDAETADDDYQDWRMIYEISEADRRELMRLAMIADIKSVRWDNKAYDLVEQIYKSLDAMKLLNRNYK